MNCKKNAKSRSDDEHRLFDPAVEKIGFWMWWLS